MLDRPPARRSKRNEKREQRRLAQREYRRRFDAGRFTVTVEIDGTVTEMLLASHWLTEDASADRKQIARAISKMLGEAAKR